jgi:AraC family transcriptional regulator
MTMPSMIMMRTSGREQALTLASSRRKSLILTSAGTTWAGLPLEMHSMRDIREAGESGPVDGEYGVMVVTAGRVDVVTRHSSGDVRTIMKPGSVSLLSGARRHNVLRTDGSATVACFKIPDPWFNRLGFQEPPDEFRTKSPGSVHPNLVAIAQTMQMEIEAGVPTTKLYAESLSLALLSYVVERMAVPGAEERVRGKLSLKQCHNLRAYIRDRLAEDVTLAELAGVVGMSPRHFSVLFREAFGTTPHRYVLQLRLQEGARRLRGGERDIAHIAFDLGFCSQSHFSAAFRKQFGLPPRRYASGS